MREEALIGTWAINRKITVSLNKRFKVLYERIMFTLITRPQAIGHDVSGSLSKCSQFSLCI